MRNPTNPFVIPPSRVDARAWPPPLLTSEPGSFAHNTFKVRIPRIVDQIIESNPFPPEIREALANLRSELLEGTIRPLHETAPDKDFWDRVSAPYFGRTWLDVPWYWAEAYFYRRVLEATGYFRPGPWQGVDPYWVIKQTEWQPEAAPRAVDAMLRDLPAAPSARFQRLLYASLWGNRTDLSYNVAAQLADAGLAGEEHAYLLVDDWEQVWAFLQSSSRRSLAIIQDNAGTELLMDLALVDFLLEAGLAARVDLHLKPQPFFVSDAMPADVVMGIEALAHGGEEARQLRERLRSHLARGRLRMYTHWFYATSLFYFQLPDDLYATLAEADLVILKGDVNYRRLLGDAHWPPTTPFERITTYFPTSLVALRTLKGELIAGLPAGVAERLTQEEPDWMVNGRRGLIQARWA